jgi:hypothetical protein
VTFILKSLSGVDIQVNAWNWAPTLLLIRQAIDLDDKRFELLGVNSVGSKVSSVEADKIGAFLAEYLISFPIYGRLLMDGTVAREPKGASNYDDGDWERHFSASYDWLVVFRDFCKSSAGFLIV